MNNRGFAGILIIGLVAVLLIAGGYWYWQNQKPETESETTPTQTTGIPDVTPTSNQTLQKYPLNGMTLFGEGYPYLELAIKTGPEYEVEPGGEVGNKLTIKNDLFTLIFSLGPEGAGYWGQYLEEDIPDYTTMETAMSSDPVFRVESRVSQYPDYYYSTKFEMRTEGGCEAYSQDIVACDGGNLSILDGDKEAVFGAGCYVVDQVSIKYCDEIISTMKVSVIGQDTTKWQEYQNTSTDVSFQFKYPPDYLMNDDRFKIVDPSYDGIHEISIYGPDIGAQGPGIKVSIYNYEETVDQFIEETRSNDTEDWKTFTSEMGYEDFEPIGIKSVDDASNTTIQAKKVYRLNYPNAPDRKETQYLFKVDNYLVVLSATYGSYNPNNGRDGTEERDYLDGILQTFEIL